MNASPSDGETSPHACIVLTIYVIHLAGDEIPSPVHISSSKENNLSVTKMSDLLIILVSVLCLQAKANIVSYKGKGREKKALEQCQPVSAGVHSFFFLQKTH